MQCFSCEWEGMQGTEGDPFVWVAGFGLHAQQDVLTGMGIEGKEWAHLVGEQRAGAPWAIGEQRAGAPGAVGEQRGWGT